MTENALRRSPAGEEFRDDLRRRGLPPEIVKRLTILDPIKSTLGLFETIGLTILLLAAGSYLWTAWPWAVPFVMVLIATRQQAYFVLAHEAAHYRFYRTRWLNDAVGRACGAVVGISMCAYRVVHRLHHNHLYQAQDPDIPIHGGYPRGRAYLAKKLLKDLTGFTAPKTYAYFFGAPAQNDAVDDRNRPLDDTAPALRLAALQDRWLVAAVHIAAPVAAFAAGWGWQYLVLWVVPLLTLLQPILRFRSICEHGAIVDYASPLTAARTNFAPVWLRWLLFPHHVNYHAEHHMYPAIPHYNLPACHAEMQARGLLAGAEVRHVFDTARLVVAEKAG